MKICSLSEEHRNIELFKGLFRGRADVFAVRWEKGNKSGYMPAYHYDPYMYQLDKMKGGSFKNYKDKAYLPLTNQQLLKHFKGEQLMNDLLKNDKVKHYRQLRYLASKHDSTILKLRFILNPFSFVFLLPGTEQYHVVLETLDTEEATYIWRVKKNKQLLWQKLQSINQDLNVIRNNGRQTFLEKQPENFSRLIHDYSEERKGFVIWKEQLEERLL